MKNIIQLTCFALLFSSVAYANENRSSADSEIKEVTLFFDGAQITRKATIDLKKGDNKITFTGLTQLVNPKSIQVKGNKNFTLLSVNHKLNFMDQENLSKEIKNLRQRLEKNKIDVKKQTSLLTIYKEEKSLIVSNKVVKSKTNGLNVETIMDLSEFYQERLTSIQYKMLEAEKKREDLQKAGNKLQQQLNELNYKSQKINSEVIVRARSNSNQRVSVLLIYNIWGVSWYPHYDLRSGNNSNNVNLSYKAKVAQNTGHDWNNVKLTLSTGNPRTNATQPTVTPWVLDYREIYNFRQQTNKAPALQEVLTSRADKNLYKQKPEAILQQRNNQIKNLALSAPSTINQGLTEKRFEILLPYTIPSDNKEYDVEIQKIPLPADYAYYTAPKFDRDAFLLAKISGWHQYNLLPGNTNLYNKDTYIGKSYISTSSTLDTLDISMGRDKDIVVERKKIDELNKTSTSGKHKKKRLGIEITIKNKKSGPVNISLVDQVPISSDKEIVINIDEKSGAQFNEETGELKWEIQIEPGASVSKRFEYVVKYPKDKTISNL